MKNYVFLSLVVVLFAGYSCRQELEYTGYTLISKKFVKEVNANCYYLEHDKSGAKVFKIAAHDPNKTFAISFKTITDSDCGTPHILEHCVLEGSKNFPVKSPFDEMSKGSLKTFLNAMTGKDMTIYPVASMNTKDYFNLMHIYLDAVFNPLVLERPSTFYQEGWHYELLDPEEPVVYKGVVYNEMKGAFSSPDRELFYQTSRHLFPDNCYRFSSGGRPEAIPDLSYEEFISYYKKHYHPTNSYIFLYGDADMERELAFIDSAYLSAYDRAEMELTIPMQEPFDEMKEVVRPYAASTGSETDDQSILRLSFVTGDGTDMELLMAMRVIQDVLVNQESAPLRLALQEAGIGRDVTAYASVLRQQTFNLTVKNANASDKDRFRETVFSTLERVVEEGLDKESIEGTLNRMEFRLREGDDAQKGITYMSWILDSWMYVGNPYNGMEYEKFMAEIKSAMTTDYLEQVIVEKLLNNPHALLLVLEPEPGLDSAIDKSTSKKLQVYKSGLDDKEIVSLIHATEELIAHQDSEDSPEALATIPKLSLEDVNQQSEWFQVEEKLAGEQKILYFDQFTNNVLYTNFYFDMQVVAQEDIPYLSILRRLLGKMDTENFSYEELEKNLNIHTGGFNTSYFTTLDSKKDDLLIPKFNITVKVMRDKSDKLVELMEEILLRSDFTDTTRLRNLLNQQLARVESNVKGNGFRYALTRQRSYHSQEGVLSEITDGLTYYWFLKELMDDFDGKAEGLVQKLSEISGSMFSKNNMIFGVSCGIDDYPDLELKLRELADRFPESPIVPGQWDLLPEIRNEGLMAASKVQYVVQGANFKALGYEFKGQMIVLNQVIESEWLHPQIRVKGGAYGGFGSFRQNGEAYFASYRDPNLSETLENFAGTTGFLKEFETNDEEITQFIIGTISSLDRPMTASQKGHRAIVNYFSNYTSMEHQKVRDEVLSTSLDDLHGMLPLVTDVLNQQAFCVYGNQEKILENEELFKVVIKTMQ